MSRSRNFQRRRSFKPPRWFTNMTIVRPERTKVRSLIVEVVKLQCRPQDEDVPMFPQGSRPNADWIWD